MSWIEQRNDGLWFRSRCARVPAALPSTAYLVGVFESRSIQPQDGEATRHTGDVSQSSGAKASDATLLQGATNRYKVVFIAGVQVDECKKRLGID